MDEGEIFQFFWEGSAGTERLLIQKVNQSQCLLLQPFSQFSICMSTFDAKYDSPIQK